MSEPTTAAGQALAKVSSWPGGERVREAQIAAIEAEAAAAARTSLQPLIDAGQAYIDWRDRRLAQWQAVGQCGHEIAENCPEWQAITDQPFEVDEKFDDAIRDALAEISRRRP